MAAREQIEQFVSSMQSINRFIRQGSFTEVEPPLTRVQWMILRYLNRKHESSIGQLANHLAVRSCTMSQMIDRLEKNDLVFRTSDSADARTRLVRMTERGRKVIDLVEAKWVETLSDPFTKLNDQEREHLVKLMTKLAENLRNAEVHNHG